MLTSEEYVEIFGIIDEGEIVSADDLEKEDCEVE